MLRAITTMLLAGSAAAICAGCASDPAPPPVTAANGGQTQPAVRQDTATNTSGSVHVDDKIAAACKLPAAHFAFDSARINGSAEKALDAVATCFTTGPMKGKGMKLVGHADPRGEVEYNFALGQKRAATVAEYLGKQGLPSDKVSTSSKGELDATGTDPDGWAKDRKVEILLRE